MWTNVETEGDKIEKITLRGKEELERMTVCPAKPATAANRKLGCLETQPAAGAGAP